MFRINPFKTFREAKHVPNKVRASARTKLITVSQPPVITKKDVNSNSNGLSSTGIDNTKTKRPQPRSNTKNDRVPSTSKSSRSKNKDAEVEEHHRNLLLSKNTKHMSSACNNIKIDSQNVISKVVCAMCKQCLISVNHDVCLRNYVNGKTSRGYPDLFMFMGTVRFGNDHVAAILGFGDLQWGNILITRVYFVEGLGHNLFSVGQFYDSYLENDHEDTGKLGAKGVVGFFIGYSTDSCAFRVYNRRTKKIMETMNMSFNELSAMDFEKSSSKLGLQSMTSGQISSGLYLTYAPSTITTQQPTEGELDLLFEVMYDDYIGGQPKTAPQTVLDAQAHPVRQTPTTSTSIVDTTPTPTNSSSQATNFPNT
uniref:Integrase, catalytic region, zinc finger, CCHC-type, peptidase aspartic, catalytic n=1 Tax=Tanacetum cinerariifolium TaxID=118510 RepID=A0A699J2I3_TANCI|nr:integrase, catalytic region, zinc finger, CCHC-type, peptidase aspartic, catalytic [Tanacetum cinerariifolium]